MKKTTTKAAAPAKIPEQPVTVVASCWICEAGKVHGPGTELVVSPARAAALGTHVAAKAAD